MTDELTRKYIGRELQRLWEDDQERLQNGKKPKFDRQAWETIRKWRASKDSSALRIWETDAGVLALRLKYGEQIKARKTWDSGEEIGTYADHTNYDVFGAELSAQLRMYQLQSAPPRKTSLQEYIDLYFEEKDDKYFAWFLHYYEPTLNRLARNRAKQFSMEDHFSGIKSACVYGIWLAVMSYDPAKGVPFLSYKDHFLQNEVHNYIRTMRPGFTVPTRSEYEILRKIMRQFYSIGGKLDDSTVVRVSNAVGLSEETIREYIRSGLRNQSMADFYAVESDEDGNTSGAEDIVPDPFFEPVNIGFLLELRREMDPAYESLGYREKDIIANRLGFCRDCLGNKKEKLTFEQMAEKYMYQSAEAMEQSYRRGLDKIILKLTEAGYCHCLRLKRKAQKNAVAAYLYQVDDDGEWGEINCNRKTQEFSIVSLAELDLSRSKKFALLAIDKLKEMLADHNLLKERLWAVW